MISKHLIIVLISIINLCCLKKEKQTENYLNIKLDSIKINNQIFIKEIKHDNLQNLVEVNGDTIIKQADFYTNLVVLDINHDGFQDLRVFINSNSENECINYLYETKSCKFRLIQNSDLDIEQLKNTDLYYSYSSIGCSDMSWESYLSKIEDSAEIKIGLISVKNCGDKDDIIEIYKLIGLNKIVIKKLPIRQFELNGKNSKIDFIKNYWLENSDYFQKE